MDEYRKHIQDAAHKSQEEFDKTVLSLSGGALGISFVFLKDVIGVNAITEPRWLLFSWIAWGLSATAVLFSYFMSHQALRKTLRQIHDGTVRDGRPGGWLSILTAALNALGALLFLAGVASITQFAHLNFKPRGEDDGRSQVSVTTPTPTASSPSAAPTSAAASAASAAGRQQAVGRK